VARAALACYRQSARDDPTGNRCRRLKASDLDTALDIAAMGLEADASGPRTASQHQHARRLGKDQRLKVKASPFHPLQYSSKSCLFMRLFDRACNTRSPTRLLFHRPTNPPSSSDAAQPGDG
jgi:hypothetical protein